MRRMVLLAAILIIVMVGSSLPLYASYEVLYEFTGDVDDGSQPQGSLIVSNGTLYGMTSRGGQYLYDYNDQDPDPGWTWGGGTIFSIGAAGNNFNLIHEFSGNPYSAGDGVAPAYDLLLVGSKLFGTTASGGAAPADNFTSGTIFSVNPDGTDYSIVHTFPDDNNYAGGRNPVTTLIASGATLYGVTQHGGTEDDQNGGTAFKMEADGTGYTVLHSFDGADDGGYPNGALVLSADKLYGTTEKGGAYDAGAIYSMGVDGSDFTILHDFQGGALTYGVQPGDSLVLSGSTLYGLTTSGGYTDEFGTEYGVIYSIGVDGSNYTVLHTFMSGVDDGALPVGSLILSGSTLYGMTLWGGDSDAGTIFSMGLGGENFTLLHEFFYDYDNYIGPDGDVPAGALVLLNNALYGMTEYGGSSNEGVIFRYGLNDPPPPPGGETPEPATIVGLGLVALAVLKRKLRRA